MASIASVTLRGLLLLLLGCASAPLEDPGDSRTRVNQTLAAHPGKDDLSQFLAAVPSRCVRSSETTELCQWQAGKRQPAWAPLTAAIGTHDRINLLCELSTIGAARAADACSAHPRRSNRYSWKVPAQPARRYARRPRESPEQVRERHRRTAERWMREARSLVELSRLMGAVPDECAGRAEAPQVCVWRTTNQTYGHGTLAIWIDASRGDKIRLLCTLPRDGGARAAGSCAAAVGA